MFSNATFFRLPPEYAAGLAAPAIEEAFAAHPLRPCGPLELQSAGFVPAEPGAASMTALTGHCVCFAVGVEQRVIPGATLRAAREKAYAAYAKAHGDRPPGGKMRRQLNAQVLDELLPKAMVKPSTLRAYFDLRLQLLVIESTTAKNSERVLTQVREALGSLPAVPLAPGRAPAAVMQAWITHSVLPAGLSLGTACVLADPASGATARVRKQDLESPEVAGHLKAGKQCRQLALDYQGRVSFTLRDDASISSLRYSADLIADSLQGEDDPAARFYAGLALLTGELAALWAGLAQWLELEAVDADA